MKICLSVFCFCLGLNAVMTEDCSRPNNLKIKEEYCWKAEIELVERIQQTSKSVLNFAKKKLGLEVQETNEPQKCTYYQCILTQLNLINPNGFPIYDHFEKWIESEVIYDQAKHLLDQLNKCNDALSNATVAGTYYDGDTIIQEEAPNEDEPSVPLEKPQTECDLAAEFIKCLSHQEGCPVFVYP